jgi:hypothetical protein
MADGYADDGLDWYRQLVAGGPNDPYGSAGNLPGSGVSGYPQASGSGPYMGYRAQQNPFPGQPTSPQARPSSWWSNLLGAVNPISSAEAAPAPQPAPQSAPGTTLNSSPLNTEAPLSISSEFPHLSSQPLSGASASPSISSEFPHLSSQPLRTPEAPPRPTTAERGSFAPGTFKYGSPIGAATSAATLANNPTQAQVEERINNPLTVSEAGNNIWTNLTGHPWGQPAPAGAPPSSKAAPPIPTPFINAQPDPTTLTRSEGERPPPISPTIFGEPPGPPQRQPPDRAPPIPPQPTFHARGGRAGAPVGALGDPSVAGGGGGGAAPPSPGEYFATTGNARGASWTPGGFASPPAQHFQTPLTPMFGPGQWIGGPQPGPAAPQAVGRGQAAPQGGGGYNVGGIFNNLPNNTFDNSGAGRGGPVQLTRLAQAPPTNAPIRTARARRPLMDTGGFAPGTGYIGGL